MIYKLTLVFIYLFWLHWVLVEADGIFIAPCLVAASRLLVAACGLLSCGMWTS